MSNLSSIALFGPSGSGKTTIIHSFLWRMSRDYKQFEKSHGMEINFHVSDETAEGGFSVYKPFNRPPDGTITWNIRKLEVSRTPRNSSNYSQQVSSHQHTIQLADDMGRLFHVAANPELNNRRQIERNEKDEVRRAWTILGVAHSIIVLLDPTLIKDSPFATFASSNVREAYGYDVEPSYDVQRFFSPAEYALMVSRLAWLDKTTKNPNQSGDGDVEFPRRIAVCITKKDVLGDYGQMADLNQLTRVLFGDQMLIALGELRSHFGEKNVDLSMISALGTDPASGKPNYDPATGWLRNTNEWEPDQVEKPFLWLLENRERDLLSDGSQVSSLFRNQVVRSRLDAYLSYLPSRR